MSHLIDDFMTRSVHTIGVKSPLTEAHRIMNEHAIRHLPVLEGGTLVGMVSMRDLHLVESLQGVDPKEVSVEEAMSQDAYTVPPGTALAEVARTMAMHKYGSAVVSDKGRVLGIFTTIDALTALDALLAKPRPAPRRKTTPRKKARPAKAAAAKRAAPKKKAPARRPAAKSTARKAAPARKRGGR
ncbi:MAG TPA: CBS domain-containing protein [Myxococcaceae bacterium]|nr:CBS domain-containing protein [Myxococcaceae bacterium]